jgi:hypothetical protein
MVTKAHEEKQTVKVDSTDYSVLNVAEAMAAIKNAQTIQNAAATADIDEQGYTTVRDKDKLVGVPFTIVYATYELGDNGWYHMLRVVTDAGKAFKFGDGGSGIGEQLKKLSGTPAGEVTMIRCPRGLRVSKYTHKETGKPSATYYLDEEDVS